MHTKAEILELIKAYTDRVGELVNELAELAELNEKPTGPFTDENTETIEKDF
jgi:hypothetical protein